MAGITAVSSNVGSISQRVCAGACAGCYACTLAALPLLALFFKKAESRWIRRALVVIAVLFVAAGVMYTTGV